MSHIVSRFMCETKRMTNLEGNKYERMVEGTKLPNRLCYISEINTKRFNTVKKHSYTMQWTI